MNKAVFDCETGEVRYEPLTRAELKQRRADERAAEEAVWADLRDERDGRLAASDWTQVSDAPLTPAQRKKWAAYRQALRDLPGKTKDPRDPSWPKPPA